MPSASLVVRGIPLLFGPVWWSAVASAAVLVLAVAIVWLACRHRALGRLRNALDIYAEREIARGGRDRAAKADAETA